MTLGTIGGFELVKPLGSGGMGEVFFAVSPTADRVALKVIRKHLIEEPTIRDRFAAEVDSLKLVFGTRIARLENADPYGDPAWLAVEYVPGATLRQHVDARGPLPLPLAAMVGAMLADGLGKVHQAGLLHRDLKPQNIILGPDGPKLIDFGLAILIDRSDYLTEPGALVGTPAYMSPEQVRGERELTAAVDVYGLAATLVFALTGHGLYPPTNSWNLLLRITEPSDLPDLSGVPAELTPLLGAMLAHDPDARPGLDDAGARLLAVATASSGKTASGLRQEVAGLTYDGDTELLVPVDLQDPQRDPEDTSAEPEDDTVPVPDPKPTVVDPERQKDSGPDVTWLVEKIRRQYARRSTL
ncbi:serine/threonine protein kinase [Micromonospora sp. HB375]|uniref:serine/threonine-protein kinase n=1 Tax=unclassified Micromonospora TaxID=2617518 RepID=UPI001AE42004|nr:MULTISPECIES: serine/threonine-protein kinase [unclassified Micromonospora]MBP1783320.1 serine/threonine protein kinase [Micromonospora sp. HB375]MDH6468969.1 serine/threonine protein kinase [Micromonospora sp. H404/HB375]